MFYDFITKYIEIIVEKIREAFALQKLLTFFQQKILAYFRYKHLKFLTKRKLTTSLVLNNRAQIFLYYDTILVQPTLGYKNDISQNLYILPER